VRTHRQRDDFSCTLGHRRFCRGTPDEQHKVHTGDGRQQDGHIRRAPALPGARHTAPPPGGDLPVSAIHPPPSDSRGPGRPAPAASCDHSHEATNAPTELSVPVDPAFGGDASAWNPEQLVVLAASSSKLRSLLEVATRGVDAGGHEDDAAGRDARCAPGAPDADRAPAADRVGGPVDEDHVRHLAGAAPRSATSPTACARRSRSNRRT